MNSAFARRWILGSALLALITPVLFAFWISREVRLEYAAGLRVSTDGDSIVLPIVGFTVSLWLLLLALTVVVYVVRWFRSGS